MTVWLAEYLVEIQGVDVEGKKQREVDILRPVYIFHVKNTKKQSCSIYFADVFKVYTKIISNVLSFLYIPKVFNLISYL